MKQSIHTMADDDCTTIPRSPSSVDLGASSVGRRRKQPQLVQLGRANSFESITEFVITDLKNDSKFFCKENKSRSTPSFRNEELELGPMLGQGEFGCVYELVYFRTEEALLECQSISSGGSSIADRGLKWDTGGGIPKEVLVINPSASTAAAAEGGNASLLLESEGKTSRSGAEDEEEKEKVVRILQMHLGDGMEEASSSSKDDAASNKTETIKSRMIRYPMREGKARYAVKMLRPDVRKDIRPDAIVDLACEAEFLSRIQHPNIIRLRGTSGIQGSSSFMLVMDRLTATLSDKIDYWAVQYKHMKGSFFPILKGKRDKEGLAKLFQERLLAAYDVARALRHLHDKSLLFRDIKPENVGLDPRGDMRLFDFGLCKELKAKDLATPPDSYNATGLTGSRRYMAPEVVRCMPYGFSADVYAFGILFWQIFALETPFRTYDPNKHFEHVVLKGKRPHPIHAALAHNKLLHRMMEDCWSEDPKRRPRFSSICQLLQSGLCTVEEMNPAMSERTKYLMDRSLKSARKLSEV